MSGATARASLALLMVWAVAGCTPGDNGDGGDDATVDMIVETDGGEDDLGPDMAEIQPDAGPDMAEIQPDSGPDMAEPDMAPDMAEVDMAPDMAPDMMPDMAPDPLMLTVDSPVDGDLVNQNPLPVSGTVSAFAVVTVNGVDAEVGEDLTWTAAIPAPDGELLIEVVAAGGAGADEVVETLTVTVDTTAPPIRVLRPTDGSIVVTDPEAVDPMVEVCVETEPGATVDLMGVALEVDEDGAGCGLAALPRLAANRIVVAATDAAGNEARTEVFVTRREGIRDSDEDEDGLTLAEEVEQYGTDPTNPDTDGDTLLDGQEVNEFGTNPQDRDTDRDGLSDNLELQETGTDPTIFDTDGGGISDGQELNFGTDPFDPEDDRVPLPVSLFDGDGFEWDLNGQGEVLDGTDDAYDNGRQLFLGDGQDFFEWPGAAGAALEDFDREVVLGPVDFRGLVLTRKIYVPSDDRFARFLELLTNPGQEPIEVVVRVFDNLGSDSNTVLVATSDDVEGEEPAFTVDDDWLVTDDADGELDPSMSHVISGEGARVEPSAVARNQGDLNYDYTVTVPPGRTVGILTFAVQSADRAEAIAQAERLVLHPAAALAGMSVAEQIAVVNFHLIDDTDEDGLPDEQELELGTDPESPDTDADGLLDLWEVENGFDPLTAGDELLDADEDGLTNLEEQDAGTDPRSADPDGDTLIDPLELELGTNPNRADTDGDGLDDGREVNETGTDPLLRDTDGGGRGDRIELEVDLTDPLDPADDLVEPPLELIDGAGFRWDIAGDGTVDTGTIVENSSTFDTGARLVLDGNAVPALPLGSQRQLAREVVFGPSDVAGLEVVRQAYVPADAQFARFVDVIRNPGDAPVEVQATFVVDLAGFSTEYADDSDGDGVLTAADDWWLAFDEGFSFNRPVVGAIFSDDEAAVQPDEAVQSFSLIDWTFPLVVPAGGEVRLMHVLTQAAPGDVAAARANLDELLDFPEALFSGMSAEERLSVVNLYVPQDADLDGIPDIIEVELGTDPANPDTDGDGLLDGFEVDYGFDPLVGGEQGLDPDEDGLDNLAEQDFGSDPNNADVDGDGLNDLAERDANTDPFSADGDGDGLTDPRELELGTDPNDPDTDDGGRLDGPEIDIDGSDPFDPSDDLVPVEIGFAFDIDDGAGFLWDITEDGDISNGSRDAYDGGLRLSVGGDDFPFFDEGFLALGAREMRLGPAPMGGLQVLRRIYIPEDGQYARFIEVLNNPTGEAIEVEVGLRGNLGSDLSTQLIDESSGDGVVDESDDWFVTDDFSLDGGDPTVLHFFSDDRAAVQPTEVSMPVPDDDFSFTFPVVVPAGETIYVMHFAAQHDVPADVPDNLAIIAALGDDVLAGLRNDERPRVVNLRVVLDTDDDGLSDDDEALLGTDPLDPDTDGDGLPDGFEVDNGLDPLVGGEQGLDPDGDGLNNLAEAAAGTDPNLADTDGDGLDDAVEVAGPTDPLDPDTDGDRLLDGAELDAGTDPLLPDTDEGGALDGDEVLRFGTDPLDPTDDRQPVNLTYDLFDGAGFEWDINSQGAVVDGGQPPDGREDAYDTAFSLVVGGSGFPGQPEAILEYFGQQLVFGPAVMGDVSVERRVYVPSDGQFARFVDAFTNLTGEVIELPVNIGGNLGSDGANVIVESSSGDAEVDADDDWWTSDDGDPGFDPKLLFLFSDDVAPVQPDAVDATGDNIDFDYTLTIEPGQTVRLMHLAAQADARADLDVIRDGLLAFGPDTLAGMTSVEQIQVVNLAVAEDTDGDLLTDSEELDRGTDPANPDTDGDGLLDGFEVFYDLDPLVVGDEALDGDGDGLDNLTEQTLGTRPDRADTDRDGLDDGDEVDRGTLPLSADSDGDGIADGDEVERGTDPLAVDSDGDGLEDGFELELETDPLDPDSDGDGIPDGDEFVLGLDPVDPADADGDPDEDGLTSGDEYARGTDPFDADSDGDELDDGDEVNVHGTDPALVDTDEGGRSDGQEVLTDETDPLDPADDLPLVELPVDLVDGAGFTWDIQGDGRLVDGTDDAYDSPAFRLQVGLDIFPSQDEVSVSEDRRELSFGPAELGGLQVSRRVYVPEAGQFIRYLEVFENPGDAEVEAQVRVIGNLGSDGSTTVLADASGDLLVGLEDQWFVTDDDGGFDPVLGFACYGEGEVLAPASLSLDFDDFTYGFTVVVPPGEQVALLHFAGQFADEAGAIDATSAFAAPDEAALMGLDGATRASVLNFELPAPQ